MGTLGLTEHDSPAWELSRSSNVRVGICSWTDTSMVEPGLYYPRGVSTAEKRLRFVSEDFPVLEVDSSYYALPAERNAEVWAERTPEGFTFNVKAYSLLTHHPTRPRGLPANLREAAGIGDDDLDRNVYVDKMPPEVTDEVWRLFAKALSPLEDAGKLTAVLFQFPEWFTATRANRDYVLECSDRMSELLPEVAVAVEFRSAYWMSDAQRQERTLAFLEENDLAYVCVDMPQGFRSSIPPVVAATADLAMIRFHGRRTETWERKNITARERFRYDYSDEELREWVPGVRELSESAGEVHVMMNNCYRDYAVRAGKTMVQLTLEDTGKS